MPEYGEVLLTVAEIGAAFAGFGALVTALAGRRGRQRAADVTSLHVSVAGGLIAVAAGILPFAVAAYAPPPEWVWRIASGFVLAINNGYALAFSGWIREARQGLGASLPSVVFFWASESGLQLPLWALVFGLGAGHEAALYLTATAFLLAQAGLLFLGLVTAAAAALIEALE